MNTVKSVFKGYIRAQVHRLGALPRGKSRGPRHRFLLLFHVQKVYCLKTDKNIHGDIADGPSVATKNMKYRFAPCCGFSALDVHIDASI
jgi:hypothetical protein